MINPIRALFSSSAITKKYPPLGEMPNDETLMRTTLRMAWPSVMESFLIAAVGFVDTIMVSTLGDTAIAAVGLTSQPKMLSLAAFLALSPAVAAVIARRRGEKDRESAVRVLKMALIITGALCAVISSLFFIFADDVLRFAGSQSDTHALSVQYFKIITAGMIFNVFITTINAAQRGVGNTKISLRTSITSNLVNIVFNYLLINGKFGFPKLGVAGAAYATVLGTIVALVMAVASLMHPDTYLYIKLPTGGIFEKRSAKSLATQFSSTFVEQLFLRVGFFIYAKVIAALGTMAFTTHQIAMNILTISFAFGDGLSAAAVALVGRALGEKRPDLARIYGSLCQRCGLLCSLFLSTIYIFLGKNIFTLFTDTPQIISDGQIIMKLMCVIVLIQISQVIYSGCLRGSGDARYTAMVSFINITILRPGIAYVACHVLGLGVIGAWVGLAFDQSIRLLMTSTRFNSGKWSKIQI